MYKEDLALIQKHQHMKFSVPGQASFKDPISSERCNVSLDKFSITFRRRD